MGSINYISFFTIYAFDAFATRHSNNTSMHIISQVKQSSEIALCLSGKSAAMNMPYTYTDTHAHDLRLVGFCNWVQAVRLAQCQ